MRLLSTALAVTAVFIATAPAIDLTAAAPKRPKDIKAEITFRDLGGDRILSDNQGPYRDGVNGVVAYLSGADNNLLIFASNTNNTPNRALQFFFDTCLLQPSDCDAPWPSLNEKAGLQANVLRNGAVPVGGMTTMADGEELTAWIKFNIPRDSDPAYWNVCYDSRKVIGPCGLAPGGTSTDARIRRDSRTQWTFWTEAGDRGDLVRDSDTRRDRTFTMMGTYDMPFEFTVTCVNAADCQ